ncbi:MAG: GtrA family protein [Burkholderiaceae bacterium]
MKTAHVQFLGYAAVGAIGTAVQYGTLIVGVDIIGSSPLISSSMGGVFGALTNYLLNYRLTFRTRKSHSEAMVKFVAVALAGLLINAVVIDLAMRFLSSHYLVAQVMATASVLIFGFAANRNWTFKEETNERASA